ncbi:Tr-type G domain-containing protein [Psidium guajava]|nr:Tr-type G domain-containing protein [Psidium guajava]
MKKLYRRSVTVHPSPPPPPISDHNHLLSLLPAAILALIAALSPQDREVLAYLVSNNSNSNRGKSRSSNCDHPPCFTCDCFRCFMSYWVRWDSSPNRQLIHEVIDAFEDGLLLKSKNNHRSVKGKNGRDRRNRSGLGAEQPAEPKRPEPSR